MKHLSHLFYVLVLLNSVNFSQADTTTTSSENGPGYEMQPSGEGVKKEATRRKKATESSSPKEMQKMEESPSSTNFETEKEKENLKSKSAPNP